MEDRSGEIRLIDFAERCPDCEVTCLVTGLQSVIATTAWAAFADNSFRRWPDSLLAVPSIHRSGCLVSITGRRVSGSGH